MCIGRDSTITATALSRFAICLEPRLKEMREIWTLIGKDGYPRVDQSSFVSVLYAHCFNRVMVNDILTSMNEILTHIDENHGLDEDEIATGGEPTSSAYQVILNNLFDVTDEDDESDFLTGIIRTSVTAESIDTLVNLYQRGRLNLNPPWQRE